MFPAPSRDRAYHSIFTTALEGGIGYWSACKSYHWRKPEDQITDPYDDEDTENFRAVIFETEDEVSREHVIDRALIAKGVHRFVEWGKGHRDPYFLRAAVDLERGNWDELDIDATIADIVVQLGLFGEVVYG